MLPKSLRLSPGEALSIKGSEIRGGWINIRLSQETTNKPRIAVLIRTPQETAVLRNALRRGILHTIRENYSKLPHHNVVILIKKKIKKEEIVNVRKELELILEKQKQ